MIKIFKGKYRFLSNFYYQPFTYKGHRYKTVEHAYQAAKTNDLKWKRKIRKTKSPALAKRIGRQAPLKSNWNEIKKEVMKDILLEKFKNPKLRLKLLATGDEKIIEGNFWGDDFWGIDLKKKKGKNILGKILMEIREELKREE